MYLRSREPAAWLLAALATLAFAGCTKSRRCSGPELCNGRDDDCDGRSDEDFVDEAGRYVKPEHCGGCGVSCSSVFPTAASTRCATEEQEPICELVSCAPGFHAVAGSQCVADQLVLCLPCDNDDQCALRTPGAVCLSREGESRCGTPCDARTLCPSPFVCDASQGQCVPDAALCACKGVATDVAVACLVAGAAKDRLCAGIAQCSAAGLGACSPGGIETCNGEDDDCDGKIDEDFVDSSGKYVGPLHCGACGTTCVAPGPHYAATCLPDANSAHCNVVCEAGFVDVDGVLATGCECQRFDGSSAPIASGTDADCDGVVDVESSFIHVSSQGSDNAEGSSLTPLRTLTAAVQRAQTQGKAVLVAEGSYAGLNISAGVRVYGGYRIDFRARDPGLYPTVLESGLASDGAPVVTCSGVTSSAVLDGFTVRGSDASTPGRGSTAMLFDGCSSAVSLTNITVLAGRGADGAAGVDGSQRVSLADLAGVAGAAGLAGGNLGCPSLRGGTGGAKACNGTLVSGGAGGAAACAETGCVNGSACANAGCSDFTVRGVCDYPQVLRLAVSNPAGGAGNGSAGGAAGEVTYNSPTNRTSCTFCDDNPTLPRQGQDGAPGQDGVSGSAGSGCSADEIAIDTAGRASALGGALGRDGSAGSGGGGGSAGAGFDVIRGTESGCSDVPGGSGGGGGSGGCGAPSGGGGGGGGGSIGIVVRMTAAGDGPAFSAVRVVTGGAGRGGDGGIGAAGGAAGPGAAGGRSEFWCARSGGRGGDGGEGGAGGGGGGGCGGPSHGLVARGTAASAYEQRISAGLTVERVGVPGQGGLGGFSPGAPGTTGSSGASTPLR